MFKMMTNVIPIRTNATVMQGVKIQKASTIVLVILDMKEMASIVLVSIEFLTVIILGINKLRHCSKIFLWT